MKAADEQETQKRIKKISDDLREHFISAGSILGKYDGKVFADELLEYELRSKTDAHLARGVWSETIASYVTMKGYREYADKKLEERLIESLNKSQQEIEDRITGTGRAVTKANIADEKKEIIRAQQEMREKIRRAFHPTPAEEERDRKLISQRSKLLKEVEVIIAQKTDLVSKGRGDKEQMDKLNVAQSKKEAEANELIAQLDEGKLGKKDVKAYNDAVLAQEKERLNLEKDMKALAPAASKDINVLINELREDYGSFNAPKLATLRNFLNESVKSEDLKSSKESRRGSVVYHKGDSDRYSIDMEKLSGFNLSGVIKRAILKAMDDGQRREEEGRAVTKTRERSTSAPVQNTVLPKVENRPRSASVGLRGVVVQREVKGSDTTQASPTHRRSEAGVEWGSLPQPASKPFSPASESETEKQPEKKVGFFGKVVAWLSGAKKPAPTPAPEVPLAVPFSDRAPSNTNSDRSGSGVKALRNNSKVPQAIPLFNNKQHPPATPPVKSTKVLKRDR